MAPVKDHDLVLESASAASKKGPRLDDYLVKDDRGYDWHYKNWKDYSKRRSLRNPTSLLFTPERDYLVRNDGSKAYAKDIQGKPVLIIGTWHEGARDYLSDLKRTWYNNDNNNQLVEVVLAVLVKPSTNNSRAKANDTDTNCQVAKFNKLVSDFPFLTIPFWDEASRFSVCGYARLCTRCTSTTVVFDKDGNYTNFYHRNLVWYGADCYPFTNERLTALDLDKDCHRAGYRIDTSLKSLLCCNDEELDLGLTKPDGTPVPCTVSTLNKGVVGLYLYADGQLMDRLYDAQWKCKLNNNSFTVVLLYAPFIGRDATLESFQERVKKLVMNSNDDWYLFPLVGDLKAIRKCWRLYPHLYKDELIMVGRNDEYFEVDGRFILEKYGWEAFPSTKASLMERKLGQIPLLGLKGGGGLLFSGKNKIINAHTDEFTLPYFESKRNILLHIGRVSYCRSSQDPMVAKYLTNWYKLVRDRENCEVIFVCLGVDSRFTYEGYISDFPWLATLCDPDTAGKVCKILFEAEAGAPALVAIHDGKVITVLNTGDEIDEHLYCDYTGSAVCPTDVTLLEEELAEKLNSVNEDFLTGSFGC